LAAGTSIGTSSLVTSLLQQPGLVAANGRHCQERSRVLECWRCWRCTGPRHAAHSAGPGLLLQERADLVGSERDRVHARRHRVGLQPARHHQGGLAGCQACTPLRGAQAAPLGRAQGAVALALNPLSLAAAGSGSSICCWAVPSRAAYMATDGRGCSVMGGGRAAAAAIGWDGPGRMP
jgi:hypothetical protein